MEKTCSKCGETKPVDEFYTKPNGSGARTIRTTCKECDKTYQRQYASKNQRMKADWYAKNRDRVKEKRKEYYHLNTAKEKKNNAIRDRARYIAKSILRPLINRLLVKQRGMCAICHRDITTKFHVDHVIPLALGGTNNSQNLQLLCPSCNLSKGAKHPIAFMQQKGKLL